MWKSKLLLFIGDMCVYACALGWQRSVLSYIGNRIFHGIINDIFIQMNIGNNAYLLL